MSATVSAEASSRTFLKSDAGALLCAEGMGKGAHDGITISFPHVGQATHIPVAVASTSRDAAQHGQLKKMLLIPLTR